MRAFVILDIVAIALFAWFCLVKVIPSCNVSLYRYRLWRLRDGLADEVRQGAFQDAAPARAVIAFIESLIVLAPQLGAVKLGVMLWSCRHVPDAPDPFKLESLAPRDRQMVQTRLDTVGGLTARHLLLGSPSGWALLVILGIPTFVISLAAFLLRGAPAGSSVIESTRHRMRHEIEVDRALSLLRNETVSPRAVAQSA
jgi:hypothetical protein